MTRRRGRPPLLNQPLRPSDPCGRCGRVAPRREAIVGGVPLCNPAEGPDCFRLILGGEPLPDGRWWGRTGWQTSQPPPPPTPIVPDLAELARNLSRP